jgi:hypothetical protein
MSTPLTSQGSVPPARRYRWPKLTWPALAALVVGLGLFFFGGSGEVSAVRVRQIGLTIPNFVSSPDFYVEVVLKDGKKQDTAAYTDTPIGGGLNFDLPTPVSLSEIAQVVLYDDDLLQDEMLDRADVDGRNCDGQTYSFEFLGARAPAVTVGLALTAVSGVCLAYVVIAFVRAHAL